MVYQTFTHQIWWVMVCYDLAHQIRCAKHTFSGWCDIPPMVCCSFGGHSTPQFLQCTEVATSLIPHSYHFPEIFAFMIGFSFTVWTKKSAKKVWKQVRGCLQNFYQSVAIHLKYVLLVLL